jgi:hypothetical protein
MNPFHTVRFRRCRALLVGLLLAVGPAAVRATAPPPGSPLARAEAFFADLQAGRTDQAFTALFADSPTTRTRTLYPAERRSDLTSYQQSYGNVIGAELLRQFHHGHSVVRLVYILKLRDFPVTCELVFYRADQAWTLSRLEFNDQFEGLP